MGLKEVIGELAGRVRCLNRLPDDVILWAGLRKGLEPQDSDRVSDRNRCIGREKKRETGGRNEDEKLIDSRGERDWHQDFWCKAEREGSLEHGDLRLRLFQKKGKLFWSIPLTCSSSQNPNQRAGTRVTKEKKILSSREGKGLGNLNRRRSGTYKGDLFSLGMGSKVPIWASQHKGDTKCNQWTRVPSKLFWGKGEKWTWSKWG